MDDHLTTKSKALAVGTIMDHVRLPAAADEVGLNYLDFDSWGRTASSPSSMPASWPSSTSSGRS